MELEQQLTNCDFSGWATRNDLKCSDGRVIKKDAFKHNDGIQVPLVWNHQHNDPHNVLGHAILKNRSEGVYAYGFFNDTESGTIGKALVQHGDIKALSIYANQLKQNGDDVIHGCICEVSLVHKGANPGAFIDTMLAHSDSSEEATIYTGLEFDYAFEHSSDTKSSDKEDTKAEEADSEKSEKTVKDVIDSMTEEQKTVLYAFIASALSDIDVDDESDSDDKSTNNTEEEKEMKHNVFENDNQTTDKNELSHADMKSIIGDAKRYGSLKESALAHAETYGIDNIDYLFPDSKSVTNEPVFINNDTGWVSKVMSGVHHTPFSRIKSVFADITEDEARARGYIKGKLKKEEVFSLLKRSTSPQTVYKKQKIDKDDVDDITDFNVIAWLKKEMRLKLDEELARAYLVGDGRLASSDDKIDETRIRPIWKDEDLYTIKSLITVPNDGELASEFVDQCVRAMKDYKGSGNPTCFITSDMLTECLLLKDGFGHRVYKNVSELATACMVKEIVTVSAMKNLTREVGDKTHTLHAIIVNLDDYNVGADKGGAVNMFDDFDIDYNQQKYLIETRCSGALVKPYSAIAIETAEQA